MLNITGAEIIDLARLVLNRGLFFTIGMIVGAVIMLIMITLLKLLPKWERGISIFKTYRKIRKWVKQERKQEEEDGNKQD